MPVDPVTQEAEPGGLLEFMISRPPWQYRETHVFLFFFKNKQTKKLPQCGEVGQRSHNFRKEE